MSVRTLWGTMSELRWTLLILGAVFIAVLAWWERRRPRQASAPMERAGRGPAPGEPPRQPREAPLTLPEIRAREPLASRPPPTPLPVVEVSSASDESTVASGVSEIGPGPSAKLPREKLAELLSREKLPERLSRERLPELLSPESLSELSRVELPELSREELPELPREKLPQLPREKLPELPVTAPPPLVDWPKDRERRVLALRLVAPQAERFAGRSLRQALAAEGFVLGQFAIFHKPDEERRAVLSAASLTRPGTFDMDTMDSQHFGGLSLFTVLPGPKSPPQAFEELVFTARNLNERLHGSLQDEKGSPLTPARIALLREQLRGTAS